jgi:transketolase
MVTSPPMRVQAAETATDLFRNDPRVAIVLSEISTDYFDEAFRLDPSRAINLGIMEQTLVGVAAGFAMEGFHPIVHTLTPFLVERPLEQIKLDFGYQALGGTFVSVGASYDYTAEGYTHHAPGDVRALLTIPGIEVFVPGTAGELDRLVRGTYANGHPSYVRTSVQPNAETRPVEVGRLEVIRRGSTATVVAVGPMLDRTLAAAESFDVTILYCTSVEPFDADGLAREAADADLVIAVEPFHEGTLAPALTAALAHRPMRFASIGVPNTVVRDYGTVDDHDRARGLDAAGVHMRLSRLLAA